MDSVIIQPYLLHQYVSLLQCLSFRLLDAYISGSSMSAHCPIRGCLDVFSTMLSNSQLMPNDTFLIVFFHVL